MKSVVIILIAIIAFLYLTNQNFMAPQTGAPLDQVSGATQIGQVANAGLLTLASSSNLATQVQPTISKGTNSVQKIVNDVFKVGANFTPIGVMVNGFKAFKKLFS